MNNEKNSLKLLGFEQTTLIQEKSFANYRHFSELILYANTGSGKTLAFLLPLVSLIKQQRDKPVAVILTPTRELALQIETVFKSLQTTISVTTCYGGHPIKTEVKNLSENPSLIIGTPGRIDDHVRRGHLQLDNVRYFVIDEFDKCLEIGFEQEIANIYGKFNQLDTCFYCSATKLKQFPSYIQLTNPIYIHAIQEESKPDIQFCIVDEVKDRFEILYHLVSSFENKLSIVFCNFREMVNDVSDYLEQHGMSVSSYHGGLEQDERERAIIKFKNSSCPILICTDLGARGLDISDVMHIVHFQLPEKEAAFIHRNGRTARMHATGNAYLFSEDLEAINYVLPKHKRFEINLSAKYQQPEWQTIYFSGGKKNKINKIDLLGFICQKGGLSKSAVGVISVLDFASYVAIQRSEVFGLLPELRKHKVKGKKLRIAISK